MASIKTAIESREKTVTQSDVDQTEVKVDVAETMTLQTALNKIQIDSRHAPENYIEEIVVPDGGE